MIYRKTSKVCSIECAGLSNDCCDVRFRDEELK